MNQSIQNNHTVSILLTEHLYRIKDFHAHKLLAHNFYNVQMIQKNNSQIITPSKYHTLVNKLKIMFKQIISDQKIRLLVLESHSSNDLINSKNGKVISREETSLSQRQSNLYRSDIT